MNIVQLLLFVSYISITFSAYVFQNAGANTGTEFWKIFGPLKIVKTLGRMNNNEAHIALHTMYSYYTRKKELTTHYWLGSLVSDDIKEAAAKYGMELWNQNKRHGPLYREADGYETETFEKLFTSEPYHKMYLVKGEKYPRIEQILPIGHPYMNSDDLYVQESPLGIVIYDDKEHTPEEKHMANLLADRLQEDDPNHKGIFCGKRDSIPNLQPTTITGACYEEQRNKEVKLFKISGNDDRTSKLEEVQGDKPFSLDILDSNECYVLDSRSLSGVFVWVGKNAAPLKYEECMVHGEELFYKRKYLHPATVTIIKEGTETTQFLMQFRLQTIPQASTPIASGLKNTPMLSDEELKSISAEREVQLAQSGELREQKGRCEKAENSPLRV